jgi:hypothetical protein
MATTTIEYSKQQFVVDPSQIAIDQGHVINWDQVTDAPGVTVDDNGVPTKIAAGTAMKYDVAPGGPATVKTIINSGAAPYTGAIFLLATDAIRASTAAAKTGYGVIIGGTIFENLLPQAADQGPTGVGIPAALKTALEAGRTAGENRGFAWRKYYDSRAAE